MQRQLYMATAATGTSAPHRATGGVPGHRYAAGFKEKKFPPIFLGHRKLPATVHGKRIFCAPNSAPPQARRRHRATTPRHYAAINRAGVRRLNAAQPPARRHDPVSISSLIRAWSATIPSSSALVSINSRACHKFPISLF